MDLYELYTKVCGAYGSKWLIVSSRTGEILAQFGYSEHFNTSLLLYRVKSIEFDFSTKRIFVIVED